jgi:hypothetical protein
LAGRLPGIDRGAIPVLDTLKEQPVDLVYLFGAQGRRAII